MFGYVRPFKPFLRVYEFDIYQAHYCGLCKQLGKSYGPFSRLTLSYDFAFLAMFYAALGQEQEITSARCMLNPLKKIPCCIPSEALEFAADCSAIMQYYKLKDNFQDRGLKNKILSALLYPFAALARNKAKRRYPEIDDAVSQCMKEQRFAEENFSSIDAVCDPSAKALGKIFSLIPTGKETQNKLTRFGYLLGRWVYLADAADDLEDDIKKSNFNPFVSVPEEKRTEIINLTEGELSHSYTELPVKNNKNIIDNIIYLGLRHTRTGCEKEKAHNE